MLRKKDIECLRDNTQLVWGEKSQATEKGHRKLLETGVTGGKKEKKEKCIIMKVIKCIAI